MDRQRAAAGARYQQQRSRQHCRVGRTCSRLMATRTSYRACARFRHRVTRRVIRAIWWAPAKNRCWCSAIVTNIPLLFVRNPGWQAVFDTDGALAEMRTGARSSIAPLPKICTVTGYHYSMPGAGTFKTGWKRLPQFVPVKELKLSDRLRNERGRRLRRRLRFFTLERETGAAAARGVRLRIIHLERGADQVVDEIDFRARHDS